jgi:glyoxylase-like metal-dependent hydrolase (beta-lactamase superfamily II)
LTTASGSARPRGNALLAGDAVSCAGDAAAGDIRYQRPYDSRARASLLRALSLAEVIYPGHGPDLLDQTTLTLHPTQPPR